MKIEAFHKATGQRVILEYDTMKEAIARTSKYLKDYGVIE